MSARVVVQDLRKSYGAVEAARGVSFEIRSGEIFGLLGPNGAGKTTTIECVIGLVEPEAGHIEVCGIDVRRHPREVRERVGAALQTTALQDGITPREALGLFGAFYRRPVAAEVLLERFSLTEKSDVAVDTLSGGQKQRLALALAFVNSPELVFLDEPTAGLDPASRRELHAEILRMKEDGHTVLLTTHYLDEAELLCDRIAIINGGRIVATGRPRDLVAASSRTQTISFQASGPVDGLDLAALPGVSRVVAGEASTILHTTTPTATLVTLAATIEARGLGIDELHLRKATLEDVFVDLTAQGRGGTS
jgi:ABC-2 type transport system ATP-binding protein